MSYETDVLSKGSRKMSQVVLFVTAVFYNCMFMEATTWNVHAVLSKVMFWLGSCST